MTFSLNGNDIAEAIEIASIVGSVVAALLVGLVIYLMVRPKRGQEARPRLEADVLDAEEMIALIDRMERRLAVLERAVGDESGKARLAPRELRNFEAVDGDRELGRTK